MIKNVHLLHIKVPIILVRWRKDKYDAAEVAFCNFTNVPKNDKSRKIIVDENGFHQESWGRLITAECGIHENQSTKQEILI